MANVLIVDDEPQIRRILSVMLKEKGFNVSGAESGSQALGLLPSARPDIVLLDISMPGMDGLATMQAILKQDVKLDCIMMTAHGSIPSAVEAMRLGAFDYLTKPFDNNELLLIINRALELRRLWQEVEELRSELNARHGFNEIVGISVKLQNVFRMMTKVAPVDATVLVQGESGTGKELVARAIHRRSRRSKGPFVPINCGAVPHSLFEVEFFGCERGAFTDAKQARAGRFEQAQGGTLFLDEVGELPLDTQVKLLRALQEHEITRLGAKQTTKVDVRVIVATNIDLKKAVQEGKFRDDLYWRLDVVKLLLPSLRERKEDIPLLIDYMMERFNREFGLNVKEIQPAARRLLSFYDWPGNIRELENVICSAMIMCEGGEVLIHDLPARIQGQLYRDGPELSNHPFDPLAPDPKASLTESVRRATEKLEKTMILTRLSEMNGNRTATAESLGISRKSLFNKIRQYGLSDEEIDIYL